MIPETNIALFGKEKSLLNEDSTVRVPVNSALQKIGRILVRFLSKKYLAIPPKILKFS